MEKALFVKLTAEDRAALDAIAVEMAAESKRPVTVSEAVRTLIRRGANKIRPRRRSG